MTRRVRGGMPRIPRPRLRAATPARAGAARIPRPRGAASPGGGGHRLSGLVVALALVGSVLCMGLLIFLRFADWAGEHPGAAVLCGVVAVPVLYVLLRAMPRSRELRRAARAGAAQADREVASAPAVPRPAAADPVHDGLTVELPDPEPGFADLHHEDFEEAVAALCERDGCRDVEVVGGAGDLGADVVATTPGGSRLVVQCKRYGPDHKVGSQDLQRFGGTCWSVHGAELAVFVTTSRFTVPAEEYATACGIRCLDGPALDAWADGSGPAPWT